MRPKPILTRENILKRQFRPLHVCILIVIGGLLAHGCVRKESVVHPTVLKTQTITTQQSDQSKLNMSVDVSPDNILLHLSKEKMCINERVDTIEERTIEHRRLRGKKMVIACLVAAGTGLLTGFIIESQVNSDKYEGQPASEKTRNAMYSPLVLGFTFGAPVLPLAAGGLAQIDRERGDPIVSEKRTFEGGSFACGAGSFYEKVATITFGDLRRQCEIDTSGTCSIAFDEELKKYVVESPSLQIVAMADNLTANGIIPGGLYVDELRFAYWQEMKNQILAPLMELSERIVSSCREKSPNYKELADDILAFRRVGEEVKQQYAQDVLEQQTIVRTGCIRLTKKVMVLSIKSEKKGDIEDAGILRSAAMWLDPDTANEVLYKNTYETRPSEPKRQRKSRGGGRALCCDGTTSPTCGCGKRRGCCSHHGGVCGCTD